MAKTKANRHKPAEPAEPDASNKACSVKGVAGEWDMIREVRDRVREGGTILDPATKVKQVDIQTCVLNHLLLGPLASRMCLAERKVPSIDGLRDEVAAFLTLNKRQGEDLIIMVEETAKALKSFCVFLKTKAKRKEVSTATWT